MLRKSVTAHPRLHNHAHHISHRKGEFEDDGWTPYHDPLTTTKKLNFALSMMDASMFIVLGVPTLYATFKMYDEYKKTEFEYTFNDYDVCAHTCDPCAARPRPSATTPPPPP